MADLTPNDLSHLSDEEFNALCPQGEHAPGPEPLSPAAQAVLDAANGAQCYGPDDILNDSRWIAAAALRAAAWQLREAYENEDCVPSADDWLDDLATELENHQ